MRLSGLALALLGSAAWAEPTVPRMVPVDVAPHVYDGGWEHFVGGGITTFDCDADRRPDIYAAGGENPAALFRNTSTTAVSFRKDTPQALAMTGVTGAYPLDIDGDHILDLAILRVGPDMLMRGLGNCDFAPFEGLGFSSGDHWSTAFSATWERGQTLPTLAFGTYVDRADPDGPFEACDTNRLYRPTGAKYDAAHPLEPGFCALSMLFSDWGRSGQADLRISNDRHYYVRGGQEQLWAMDGEPRLYSADDGWQPYTIWGMGIASRDVTGDGFPEVYLTSMGDQKYQLFDPNTPGPVWRDATYEFGTTAHRPYSGGDGRPSTGWHAEFGDLNNDSRDDLFVSKGNVEQMPSAAMKDPNSLLLQKKGGTFIEAGQPSGLASMARGRGAVLADFNLDGWLDVAVLNRRAPLEIYQNTAGDGHWLMVEITMPPPNTQAIGAFVELRTQNDTQTREITVGGGHASGEAGLLHFGLGEDKTAELRVIWPDGQTDEWRSVVADQIVSVRR